MATKLKQLFRDIGELDKKSVDALIKALDSNNLQGFDYIEFKQSLGALADLNMDKITAVKSAYATAATLGLSKAKLLKTADYYKDVLSKEKKQFDLALKKQVQQRIEGRKDELAQIKAQIKVNEEKIAQLTKQNEVYQNKIDNADKELAATKKKLQLTTGNFETAYKHILELIDEDVQMIKDNL